MHKYDTKIQNCHSFDKINSKTIWKSLKINKALVLERCFFYIFQEQSLSPQGPIPIQMTSK